jgi:murein DD-endopeptidase MepM/ murein hydrolase activator NlpD
VRRPLLAAAGATVALTLLVPGAARADTASDLAGAQKQANAAAGRFAAAQTAVARVEGEVAGLRARRAAAELRLGELQHQVRAIAVERYVKGGVGTDMVASNLLEAARGQALLRFAVTGSLDAIDQYRAAREDLDASTAALQRRVQQQGTALADLRKRMTAAEQDVTRLAAAQRALEAKQAAAAARQKAARAAASRRAAPAGGPTSFAASGSWMCPVQGPHAFSNDWHQPRSGGRLHQGNDILAPRGTPVVASVNGSVSPNSNGLGGLAYFLKGDDGITYYGAHLDSYAGISGRVSMGTVIGRVGDSGDARGGPTHLHFEMHPGGGGAVNPYPTLTKYC